MNTSWTKFGLGVCALTAIAGNASAQKASSAERGLVGINLYDSGVKVVSLYGSPDEIQAVTIGGGSTSGGGGGFGGPGFGGPGGGPPGGGPGGGGRGGRGAGAGAGASADWNAPFNFANDLLFQVPLPTGGSGTSAPAGGPPPGAGGPSFGPPPGAGGGGAPLGGGQTEVTQYTRWVYNRAGSKYGFIVDSQGRVVQIEAIGMQNNRVKTRKGLGFGATFAQLIKTYGNPDGYEVGGDTLLVKYLVNKKVAFRLTRLGVKKPHVVTGIVVSAGKV